MKKQIPILMSTMMVQAELAYRKTMTRRTSGLDEINKRPDNWEFSHFERAPKGRLHAMFVCKDNIDHHDVICPYGQKGDILWVRETWRKYCRVDENGYTHFDDEVFEFAADGHTALPLVDGDGFRMYNKDGSEKYVPWRPSIHMHKVRARIWLEVTDIRVERLYDICEADAIAEGIEPIGTGYRVYTVAGGHTPNAIGSFSTLWASINGTNSLKSNPWVWVVSFKILSTTGEPEGLNPNIVS